MKIKTSTQVVAIMSTHNVHASREGVTSSNQSRNISRRITLGIRPIRESQEIVVLHKMNKELIEDTSRCFRSVHFFKFQEFFSPMNLRPWNTSILLSTKSKNACNCQHIYTTSKNKHTLNATTSRPRRASKMP